MAYPTDIDEYRLSVLKQEIETREQAKKRGECSYCFRKIDGEPVCKFPDRHKGMES